MTIKRKIILLIPVIITLLVSSIWFYRGHFLLIKPEKPAEQSLVQETKKLEAVIKNPVQYSHISTVIDGNKQEINILEIDPADPKVKIEPVLSYDSVFGFEKLSTLYHRSGAYAAVNAGFFYEFGNPAGMVAIDGKLITKSTEKNPVLILSQGKASLRVIDSKLWALYKDKKILIKDINAYGDLDGPVIFTRDFGIDNRVKTANTSLIIENETITGIISCKSKTDIPKGGSVLTFPEPLTDEFRNTNFMVGEKIKFSFEPTFEDGYSAYECGSWLVKDGKAVIGDRDEWVGVLTNWDPRTAVGLKEDGKVVLLTVDGRQPGYSVGLTAKELARYFISMGVKDAAMLDGGASTEMILNGQVVSKPSFKGAERLIGGAIVIKLTGDN